MPDPTCLIQSLNTVEFLRVSNFPQPLPCLESGSFFGFFDTLHGCESPTCLLLSPPEHGRAWFTIVM